MATVIYNRATPQTSTIVSSTTASLTDQGSDNIAFTGFNKYALLKVETSAAAWVTLYVDEASRTADASRSENVDPLPGSGVVAEVITTGANTQLFTPVVVGFNNTSESSDLIYAKVVNKSGVTQTIQVTLTLISL